MFKILKGDWWYHYARDICCFEYLLISGQSELDVRPKSVLNNFFTMNRHNSHLAAISQHATSKI
jgi:hypothetical protein